MGELLSVRNLKTSFHTRKGIINAVNGADFSVTKGQCLGIVGESGSGKSVSVMSVLGLIPTPPGRITEGRAEFLGTDLLQLPSDERRRLCGRKIGMIFQDPMTSLNPYLKISTQLTEAPIQYGVLSERAARTKAIDLMSQVGIADAEQRMDWYPHEFSGGMRQRLMIAMALMMDPELLIADEPTTALDVTVQAQILRLLHELQQRRGMGLILITHDLGVIAGLADEVVVMYGGRVVERGSCEAVFQKPRHPYTEGLLLSVPKITANPDEELFALPGLPPDPSKTLPGCAFAPRCGYVMKACREPQPVPFRPANSKHHYLCYLEGR